MVPIVKWHGVQVGGPAGEQVPRPSKVPWLLLPHACTSSQDLSLSSHRACDLETGFLPGGSGLSTSGCVVSDLRLSDPTIAEFCILSLTQVSGFSRALTLGRKPLA